MTLFRTLLTSILAATLAVLACRPTEKQVTILTGGIRHESNSFCPHLTTEENFTLARGRDALQDQQWATVLRDAGVKLVPTLHAYAGPYGVVSRVTYEKFRDEILAGAREAGTVDGVYLDLHGALHVEGYEDAQVDFVNSLRQIVGDDVLISASLDLHGNLSPEFMQQINIGTAYRTAPHTDSGETRARAVRLLLDAIRANRRPAIAFVPVPIIVPGEKGITTVEPLRSLYGRIPKIAEVEGLLDASIMVGMPWTDVPRASMSVFVVAEDESRLRIARQEGRRLAADLWERRSKLAFDVPTDTIDGAIRTALKAPEKTLFITDSGDNITAGAAGDSTLVLEKLLAYRVKDAVVAGIVDPEAVEACARAGVGDRVKLSVGGKIDTIFGRPLSVSAEVRRLTESEENGRSAVVDVDGVHLVLLSVRRSFTDPEHFQEVQIDPLSHKIVVVKLGYLFAPLRKIAPRTIMALTPGFANQVIEKLPYKNLQRPIYPLDPDMTWSPPEQ